MARFFANDPKISFVRVDCPFCKKPSGSETDCEELSDDSKMVVDGSGNPLNVFSKSCSYRNNKKYMVDINYPASAILLGRIKTTVPGINEIYPGQAYKFFLDISTIFDESEVKKKIAQTFRTYIKELQVLELNDEKVIKHRKVKVTMPNGESSIIILNSPSQEALLSEIKTNFASARIEDVE